MISHVKRQQLKKVSKRLKKVHPIPTKQITTSHLKPLKSIRQERKLYRCKIRPWLGRGQAKESGLIKSV